MKESKECPKCTSPTIGLFPSGTVTVGNKDGTISLGGSFGVEIYACADCGYSEIYMATPLKKWRTAPEETELEFVWFRPPPADQGPYR